MTRRPVTVSSPTLRELFGALHRQLEGELGIAREAIEHSGTKGTVSEDKWISMLSRHLPERYRVNRAFVIDSCDHLSRQLDIVIHDRQYSPFVLDLDGARYVPAESVYAVLEVKQTLNAENVQDAAEKIAGVRQMKRTSLPIPHAGGEYPPKPPHPIIGGILALDSDWSPPLGTALQGVLAAAPEDGYVDIGCAALHGVFTVTRSSDERARPVVALTQSGSALAHFMLRLLGLLQALATAPRMDVDAYAARIDAPETL